MSRNDMTSRDILYHECYGLSSDCLHQASESSTINLERMVRPFLGWFERMNSESGVDIRREVHQGQDAPLHRGEWRQMTNGTLGFLDNRKRDLLEGFQEPLSGRTRRGPLGVSGVQPCQLSTLLRQLTADNEFEQGQDTQGDRQQANQSSGMVVSGHHRELDLVEVVELADHPWFVATQYHPEFQSKPTRAHPLFREFVKAACERKRSHS